MFCSASRPVVAGSISIARASNVHHIHIIIHYDPHVTASICTSDFSMTSLYFDLELPSYNIVIYLYYMYCEVPTMIIVSIVCIVLCIVMKACLTKCSCVYTILFDNNIGVWHLMLKSGIHNKLWHSTSYVYNCCSMYRVPRSLQGCKSRSSFSNGENERKPPGVSKQSQKQTLYS